MHLSRTAAFPGVGLTFSSEPLEDDDRDFYFVCLELTKRPSSQEKSTAHLLLKIPIVSNEYLNDITIHSSILVYNLSVDFSSSLK